MEFLNKSNLIRLSIGWLFHSLFLSLPLYAAEDVKIKILAVNPSPTESLDTFVSSFLPPEVGPEDIIDKGGMDVKFDTEKQTYSLILNVKLAPKEVKTIIVQVRNVWKVADEDLSDIRDRLEKSVKTLVGTPYEATGKTLSDKINEKLSGIEEDQSKAIGIQQRVEMFRAHKKQLESIRKELLTFNELRRMKEEAVEGLRTVKFVVTAENATAEKKTLAIRADLPRDIQINDVIDRAGFSILYDEARNRYSVYRQDDLEGKEKRTYEVVLKDIWFVPKSDMDFYKKQVEKLVSNLESSEYEAYSVQVSEFINKTFEAITSLQEEVQSAALEDRIRAFVLNSERIEVVKKKIKELQDLQLEVPIKKDLNEFERIRQAVKELSKVVDILRLGFTPDLSTTWWIILGVMAFLFVTTAIFYMSWLVKLQDDVWSRKKKLEKLKKSAPPPAADVPAEEAPKAA